MMCRIWICLQPFSALTHCAVAGELCTECWNGCGYIRWIQQESIRLSNQSPCAHCLAAPVWVSVQGYSAGGPCISHRSDFLLLSSVLSGIQL